MDESSLPTKTETQTHFGKQAQDAWRRSLKINISRPLNLKLEYDGNVNPTNLQSALRRVLLKGLLKLESDKVDIVYSLQFYFVVYIIYLALSLKVMMDTVCAILTRPDQPRKVCEMKWTV